MSEPMDATENGTITNLIPRWTYNDYAGTLTPYEYVYSLKNDLVRQSQAIEIVADRAKAVGYKTFKGTYTAYKKTLAGSSANPFSNTTEFDGQPLELECANYIADDMGVFTSGPNGQIQVCSHPIMPIKRLVNIDTGEVKQEIAFKRGNRWRTAIFNKTTLGSAQKIIELAGCGVGVDSENARELVKYLSALENENYDRIPEVKSVGRLGWVKGYGFSPYVDSLVFDGEATYKHAFESVHSYGSKDAWMTLAGRVRAGKSIVARCALAASFASVLVGMLDALPFMVHMWGGAGAGKTVGLMLAASVWAAPSVGDFTRSFNGTPVASELSAAFCGSLPLCLDELQCIKGRKDFDDIIYMLCEGVGKARGAKGGGLQRMGTWRNCTISTGEMPLTTSISGGGALNRVIELDCADEQLFEDPREAVAIMTHNYGYAGKAFIAELNREDVQKYAREAQESFYSLLSGKVTDKQALAASVIMTADAVADLVLFEDGRALTVDEILPRLITNAQANTHRHAYAWLCDLVASNPSRFTVGFGGEYAGECWGCVENDRAWIIKGIFDREMTKQGYNSDSFLSWAKRAGLI
ncbi:MAG: DUF927 domain-containing protein, partial [Raoultibacter sp.]